MQYMATPMRLLGPMFILTSTHAQGKEVGHG